MRQALGFFVLGLALGAANMSEGQERKARPARPEPEKSALEARLIAKEDTYTLAADQRGKKFADHLKSPTAKDLPAPPEVDLVLELKNPTDAPISILVGSDAGALELKLEGDGAVTVDSRRAFTREFRFGKQVEIAPGKTYEIPIKQLSFGFRNLGTYAYWTEPGEYKLSAAFRWPDPAAGMGPARKIYQVVSEPIEIMVKEE